MWRSLLTLPGSFGIVNFPKLEGVADAFTKPHLVKRAVIFVSATNALQVHPVDVVIYWRNNVLMFVRLRRPSSAGERCFRLFLCKNPKT